MELAVKKILVFMHLLPHLNPLSTAANLRKEPIFLHDPQNCFRVAMHIALLKPLVYASVAVGMMASLLALPDLLGQCYVTISRSCSLQIVVVAAA